MVKIMDIGRGEELGTVILATEGAFRKGKKSTVGHYCKRLGNYKTFFQPIQLGAINVTYTTVPGMLSLKNQTVGNLAEPEVDFVPVIGFLILEEGQTAAAINITILEVKLLFFSLLLY